jgi:enamine deaminase RidA (YjgF/YER057c/UK114 family)
MATHSRIQPRLSDLGLQIPPAQVVPGDVRLVYRRAVRHGDVVYLAGHGPTWGDGWGSKLGKVGEQLTVEEGIEAAKLTALNMLGTIERELGDLDGVETWLKVNGYVNGVSGFTEQARVINGCSDVLVALYGEEKLAARTSIGVPDLPFGMPVEIDAVLAWKSQSARAASQSEEKRT